MLDGYEEPDQPWRLCRSVETCPQHVYVDHMSASIVNRQHPFLYPGATPEGIVLAPDTPILCGFDHDGGTGVAVHGGCQRSWTPSQLSHIISAARGFNEIIIARDAYEARLPHAVQAILYTGDDGSRATAIHAKFLKHYHLTAAQVPLLRVRAIKSMWTQWAIESLEDVFAANQSDYTE